MSLSGGLDFGVTVTLGREEGVSIGSLLTAESAVSLAESLGIDVGSTLTAEDGLTLAAFLTIILSATGGDTVGGETIVLTAYIDQLKGIIAYIAQKHINDSYIDQTVTKTVER